MKTLFLTITSCLIALASFSQSNILMSSDYSSENRELRDILQFEGIEYLKLNFTGKDMVDKSYHLSVKEIWNGEIKNDTTIIDSKSIPIQQFQKINDTTFKITIISKLTIDNQLKMTFKLPRFSITKKFDAVHSDDYSLRNVAEAMETDIKYGEKFYLLAYILPYEKDGSKYWCAVESSGKDIEKWGKEFGIEHYLVFEMLFE